MNWFAPTSAISRRAPDGYIYLFVYYDPILPRRVEPGASTSEVQFEILNP